jgi:uncharacterized protein YndB with AHSA1/START domain
MSRTVHATFTIEREYPLPIPRVFAAWADPKAKAQWFAGPKDWKLKHREQEFRGGGAGQGALLDGFDDAGGREKGTEGLLISLESFLKKNG